MNCHPTSEVVNGGEFVAKEAVEGFCGRDVLIVDDNPQIVGLIAYVLKQSGWTVHQTTTAEEALNYFEAKGREIGVALLDMVLPGIDGVELARRLREFNPRIGIVMLSGNLGEEMRWVVSHDRHRYLPKPFTFPQLLDVVTAARGDFEQTV